MNKMLLLALLLTPTLAFAQTAPVTTTTGVTIQQETAAGFAHRKAKMLDLLKKRAVALEKRQQCVQAAGTSEALSACIPQSKARKK